MHHTGGAGRVDEGAGGGAEKLQHRFVLVGRRVEDVDERMGVAQRIGHTLSGQHVDAGPARRRHHVVAFPGQQVDDLLTDLSAGAKHRDFHVAPARREIFMPSSMMEPVSEHEGVRIGTAEREEAMALLSRQFTEGRLNPDEFSERSAAVAAAVTRADIEPIFADLPAKPGRWARPRHRAFP